MSATRVRPSEKETAANVVEPCPVERAIQVIGGKWKLLLLRTLLLKGPQGYNELLVSVSGISSKELTRNLRDLVCSGLVKRSADGLDRTAPYVLTDSGKGLMPTFKGLLAWGKRHAL